MSALEHSQLLFCRQFSVFDWEKIWNCSITFKLSVCIFFDGDLAVAHLLGLSSKLIWQNFFIGLIELTVCCDTDCKDGKKIFDVDFFLCSDEPKIWNFTSSGAKNWATENMRLGIDCDILSGHILFHCKQQTTGKFACHETECPKMKSQSFQCLKFTWFCSQQEELSIFLFVRQNMGKKNQ